jgi:hypothetical protein
MDKLEELEATITQLQQEHDRLKNEDLDTTDTTDRPEEATAERHQNTEAQAAETATANSSNQETPDAMSLVLIAESSRQPSLPSQGLQPRQELPPPGSELGLHESTNEESSPNNYASLSR